MTAHEVRGAIMKAREATEKLYGSEVAAAKATADELKATATSQAEQASTNLYDAIQDMYTALGIAKEEAKQPVYDYEHLVLHPLDQSVADLRSAGKSFWEITEEAMKKTEESMDYVKEVYKEIMKETEKVVEQAGNTVNQYITVHAAAPVIHFPGITIDFGPLAAAVMNPAQALAKAFLEAFEKLITIDPEKTAEAWLELQKAIARRLQAEITKPPGPYR